MAILDPVDPEPLVTERDKTRTQAGDPVAGKGVGFTDAVSQLAQKALMPSPEFEELPSGREAQAVGGGPGFLAEADKGGFNVIRGATRKIGQLLSSGKTPRQMAEAVTDAYTGSGKKEVFGRLLKTGVADDAAEANKKANQIERDAKAVKGRVLSEEMFEREAGTSGEGTLAGRLLKSTSKEGGPVAAVSENAPNEATTMAHEMTHGAMLGPNARVMGSPLETTDVTKIFERNFPARSKLPDKISDNHELHARLNQIRFQIDPENPWRKFDAGEVGTAIADLAESGSPDVKMIADAAKGQSAQETSETIANVLNKMFTAGGAAAVASTQSSDQQEGTGD